VNGIWPFVLLALVFLGFGIVIFQQLRTDKQMSPIKESVLADPPVKTFSGVRVQLNPGTQRSGFLKGGSELTVRSRSFDFGLALPLPRRVPLLLQRTRHRNACRPNPFGNTRNRDCILITGRWGGKQMDAAIAAEGQLNEIWMFLVSAGVNPMSEAPTLTL
jgi:hypothetical protein